MSHYISFQQINTNDYNLILRNKENIHFYISYLLSIYDSNHEPKLFKMVFLALWQFDSKIARKVIDTVIEKYNNCWTKLFGILSELDSSFDKYKSDKKYPGLYQTIVTRLCKQLFIDYTNPGVSKIPTSFSDVDKKRIVFFNWYMDDNNKVTRRFDIISYKNFSKILFNTLRKIYKKFTYTIKNNIISEQFIKEFFIIMLKVLCKICL